VVQGERFFKKLEGLKLEGMVAKRKDNNTPPRIRDSMG
jgi:hypothetical protein